MKVYKKRNSCRLCGSKKILKFLDLPSVPPGEQLKKKINKKHYDVPIDLFFCLKCYHVQLLSVPSNNLMWNNEYTFMPGYNPDIIRHFNNTVLYLKNKFNLNIKKSFKTGSNDGLFLSLVRKHFSSSILGAEPSLLPRKIAKKKGIKILNIFFDYKNSKNIKKKYGRFDLVVANNVFAHCDNLSDMLKGIENILDDKGYFVFEASNLLDVLKKKLIGTIIHEHLSVHSITSLVPFFKKHNLEIIDVLHNQQIQGGVIVGIVKKINKKNTIFKNVKYHLENEKKFDLKNKTKLINYAKEFKTFFKKFNNQILKYNIKKNIICIGAARSLPIILKLLGIEYHVKSVLDENKFKFNKYLPSKYIIKINNQNIHKYSSKNLYLITAWVHTERVINNLKKKILRSNRDIKVITIFPKFKIFKLK